MCCEGYAYKSEGSGIRGESDNVKAKTEGKEKNRKGLVVEKRGRKHRISMNRNQR